MKLWFVNSHLQRCDNQCFAEKRVCVAICEDLLKIVTWGGMVWAVAKIFFLWTSCEGFCDNSWQAVTPLLSYIFVLLELHITKSQSFCTKKKRVSGNDEAVFIVAPIKCCGKMEHFFRGCRSFCERKRRTAQVWNTCLSAHLLKIKAKW